MSTPLHDTIWQRRGISWIWEDSARKESTFTNTAKNIWEADEVWSLRRFLYTAATQTWRKEQPDGGLPSAGGNALVVGGLEASLDLLSPEEAEQWLRETIKKAILAFQQEWERAALIFWLPLGDKRLKNQGTVWEWHTPQKQKVAFGRILWGTEQPQEIKLPPHLASAGLYYPRFS